MSLFSFLIECFQRWGLKSDNPEPPSPVKRAPFNVFCTRLQIPNISSSDINTLRTGDADLRF